MKRRTILTVTLLAAVAVVWWLSPALDSQVIQRKPKVAAEKKPVIEKREVIEKEEVLEVEEMEPAEFEKLPDSQEVNLAGKLTTAGELRAENRAKIRLKPRLQVFYIIFATTESG